MLKYGIDPEELKKESSEDETEEFLENVNEDRRLDNDNQTRGRHYEKEDTHQTK